MSTRRFAAWAAYTATADVADRYAIRNNQSYLNAGIVRKHISYQEVAAALLKE